MFLRLLVRTVARIVFVVLLSGMVTRVSAQPSDCAITGVLFNPDGTAASLKQVSAISVVKSGSSFLIARVTIITDAGGLATFVVPKSSTLWIPASALGISQQGDLALPIPDADTAALNVLALQGKPPVAGFSLTSGANPSLAVSLKDFGINLTGAAASPALTVESFNGRTGAVALAGSDVTSALGFTPVEGDLRISGSIVIGSPALPAAQLDILANDQPWAVLRPSDPAAKPFWFHTNTFPNLGDARNNQVMRFGWNLAYGGGRIDPSDGALGYEFEGHYAPNVNRYFEHHFTYVNSANRVYRPMSWMMNKGTDFIEGAITSSRFDWYRPEDGAQWMVFQPFQINLASGTVIMHGGNNTRWFNQLNRAGTVFIPLMYLNSADVLSLAPTGISTSVGGDLTVSGSLSVVSGVTIPNGGNLALNGALSVGSKLAISASAPTIVNGFGTGSSITNSNGTAAFTVRVGSGGTANSGVIALPAAANGWNCFVSDRTTDIGTRQISTTTTSAMISAVTPWMPSDILQVSCWGY